MKKQPLLISGAVIAVLLVIGGIVYWQTSTGDDAKTSSSQSSESTKSSILGVSGSGKAQKCTMNYSSSNGSGTGTLYTDGKGQGRYIFTAETEQGNSGEINQVIKDGMSYSWLQSGGKTIGFKVKVDASSTAAASATSGSTSGPDLNSKFDMKCQAWNVDQSQLQVPSDINFIEANGLGQ
jgi:hypothetical protein